MSAEFCHALRNYIRAGYPLLYVVTPEEDRALELIAKVLDTPELIRRKLFLWSVSRGLSSADRQFVDKSAGDPRRLLPMLLEFSEPSVFVLADLHPFLDSYSSDAALLTRQLRDLIAPFKAARKTLILLSPLLKIPPELEKDITVVDLALPDEAELATLLDRTAATLQDDARVAVHLTADGREQIVKALSGLTRAEAENALAKVIVSSNRIDAEDVSLLLAEKEQIIRRSGVIEYYPTPERFGAIGGLDELKHWLQGRGKAFCKAARTFGLPSPKGILLVGVPGCGKSLTAKAVAAEWKMPLLRFDLGKVFGGLVGQSEENMRRALRTAEAVAPCVLWVDELEKALAGSRSGLSDGGVAQRIFGTLLTWMEENKKQVFTVATANHIHSLPPELLRKGRFDEIFFVDLPTAAERAAIFAIHLAKHGREASRFDVAAHAAATVGFSGAELEQVVTSALFDAFDEGESTSLDDRHLSRAITACVPLSRSMSAYIDRLREEARSSWRMASSQPQPAVDDARLPQLRSSATLKSDKPLFDA